jgi:hypothetical protein
MRVRASSLNYRDLMVLKGGGRGPTKLGVVPLSDGAGEVAAIGDGVTRVKVGDRIAGTFSSALVSSLPRPTPCCCWRQILAEDGFHRREPSGQLSRRMGCDCGEAVRRAVQNVIDSAIGDVCLRDGRRGSSSQRASCADLPKLLRTTVQPLSRKEFVERRLTMPWTAECSCSASQNHPTLAKKQILDFVKEEPERKCWR